MPASPPSPHRFAGALDRIAEGLDLVEHSMREQLASASELLPLLGQHVLGSGGKRMRPALVLLAAELCGYTGPRRIGLAAAIELLHSAAGPRPTRSGATAGPCSPAISSTRAPPR
jgi:octaprenyl-diphosphate synthase